MKVYCQMVKYQLYFLLIFFYGVHIQAGIIYTDLNLIFEHITNTLVLTNWIEENKQLKSSVAKELNDKCSVFVKKFTDQKDRIIKAFYIKSCWDEISYIAEIYNQTLNPHENTYNPTKMYELWLERLLNLQNDLRNKPISIYDESSSGSHMQPLSVDIQYDEFVAPTIEEDEIFI